MPAFTASTSRAKEERESTAPGEELESKGSGKGGGKRRNLRSSRVNVDAFEVISRLRGGLTCKLRYRSANDDAGVVRTNYSESVHAY